MKNVLITGATGGIGKALVERFYNSNFNIVASGTNNEKLKFLESKYSNKLKSIKCDLSDKSQVENLASESEKFFGQIDILINNAGITKDNLFLRMKDEEWYDVINVNLNANYLLTKLILRGMIKKKWGRIINITSDASVVGNPGQANYAASKAAVEGLTRTIANEVAKRGVTVNCVSPGFINTDILSKIESTRLESMMEKVPLGRMGEVNEVADLIFFLSSEESAYITGQVLHINGGLTM